MSAPEKVPVGEVMICGCGKPAAAPVSPFYGPVCHQWPLCGWPTFTPADDAGLGW